MSNYTGYGLPAVFEPYPFISQERFNGKLQGKVVSITGASPPTMQELTNAFKVIVTGTSVGIGRSIAKAIAAAGASVACIARREPELKTLCEEIKAAGGHAVPVVADVSAQGAAQKIVCKVESELGPVDVLVNNAGIARIGPVDVESEDLDIWWKVYEVNVRAPVSLIRAVLPGMIERKAGIVISVSSNVATMRLPCMTAYASSKAAISKFHESLLPELEGTGVLSFALNPGLVKSELGSPVDAMNKAGMQHPAMQSFMKQVEQMRTGGMKNQEPELPAQTTVALAAEPRCKVLTGHHINAEQDLEKVLEEAEKEGMGRVGKERLYLVNIGFL